jgi:hypothetical protein
LTKKFLEQLANNIPNSEMFDRTLADMKKDLNKEYPKLLKAINDKKLTQTQKKEAAMAFTELLEEFAEVFDHKKDS